MGVEMSRWFRHYAGMMRDDKLVRVAIRSKQTIERVVWVWGAILESAAEIDDNGRYDLDSAEIAYFLRADQADIDAVLDALTDAGRLADGIVVKWGNRQFSSDKSNARVAKYRERKRAKGSDDNGSQGKCNNDVTSQERDCNAPETETDTDTDITPLNPPKGGVAKPDDLDPIVWRDWLRARRKPPTETAMKRISREAEKAGITLAEAIKESAENGWQGFKADWLKGNGNERNGKSAGGNGVASALDKRIGPDGFTRAPGRSAIGYGGGDSASAAPRIASLR